MANQEITARMGLDASGFIRGMHQADREQERLLREQEQHFRERMDRLSGSIKSGLAKGLGVAALLTGGALAVVKDGMEEYAKVSSLAAQENERFRESFMKLKQDIGREATAHGFAAIGTSGIDRLRERIARFDDWDSRTFGDGTISEVRRLLVVNEELDRQQRAREQMSNVGARIRAFSAEGSQNFELIKQVEIDKLRQANDELKRTIESAKDLATNEKMKLQEDRARAFQSRMDRLNSTMIDNRAFDAESSFRSANVLLMERGMVGQEGFAALSSQDRISQWQAINRDRMIRHEVEQNAALTDEQKREELRRRLTGSRLQRDQEAEQIRRQRESLTRTARDIYVGSDIAALGASHSLEMQQEGEALSIGLRAEHQIEQIRHLGLGRSQENALIASVKASSQERIDAMLARDRAGTSLDAGFGILAGQQFRGPSKAERSVFNIENILGRIETKLGTLGALT